MNWDHNPIGVYLMSCYAYEKLDKPFLTDYEFDMLGRYIDKHWDNLDHPHKKYIDREGVAFTSSITVPYHELPLIVLTATHQLLRSGKPRRSFL